MPHQIIPSGSKRETPLVDTKDFLIISEFFSNTIQGEGNTSGQPSTFMRLTGCTLKCIWCDTTDVWMQGEPYSFEEICQMIEGVPGLLQRFEDRVEHLIITGGSPLKQQSQLIKFLEYFRNRFYFRPFIEIENESVLLPHRDLISRVDKWNNSPKLSNSGMKERARLKPEVLQFMSMLENSTFKFVINSIEDWVEIERDFLQPSLISKNQIILMPCGQTQEELLVTRPIATELAIREGVRFSDRLHVTIWDKKTGV